MVFLTGASLDRPALLADVRADKITIVAVYKVDRLTRSLADFAMLVELFDQHGVSFVSITQSFNTTSSMGRLTLNVLLSFAQFVSMLDGDFRGNTGPADQDRLTLMNGDLRWTNLDLERHDVLPFKTAWTVGRSPHADHSPADTVEHLDSH